MKICPECALANDERFPACIVCHTPLADVRSTPSGDPAHPEHARRALERERRWITRRQLAWAAFYYLLVILGLAVCPGFVFASQVQALYAATGLVVGLALCNGLVGMFLASFLQGAGSLALFLCFGPLQPFAIFMLVGHVVTPMVFHHWVEMIHEANR